MSTPEPTELPFDGIAELRYNRDTDRWTATIDDVEVVLSPGVEPNQVDLADGLAAVNVPQHPN